MKLFFYVVLGSQWTSEEAICQQAIFWITRKRSDNELNLLVMLKGTT